MLLGAIDLYGFFEADRLPDEFQDDLDSAVQLSGVQVDRNKYPALQRNAVQVKGKARVLPKPLIVTVNINGHPARALLDSGSLGDFMSANLADQLEVEKEKLELPLTVQLAVQGSRSRVN
jgi:hypothetical protein